MIPAMIPNTVCVADCLSVCLSISLSLSLYLVMRLYKPQLFVQGVTGGAMLPTTMSEATATQHEFALSSMLILPDSFGYVRRRSFLA